MEIKIDEASIKDVVAAAIMDQLGAEGREKLVQAALTYLLTEPPKQGYGYQQPSPLQQAFNAAAATAANQIVREQVAESPEFVARIKQVVGEAMVKIDEQEYSTHVAYALAEALKK